MPPSKASRIAQMIVDSVVDSAVDYAIYLLDLDGTVKSWNAGAQRIQGYSAQEIIGSNFSVFYTDDDVRAGAPVRALEIARTTGTFVGQRGDGCGAQPCGRACRLRKDHSR
jgi:PAS domain-containing protein